MAAEGVRCNHVVSTSAAAKSRVTAAVELSGPANGEGKRAAERASPAAGDRSGDEYRGDP